MKRCVYWTAARQASRRTLVVEKALAAFSWKLPRTTPPTTATTIATTHAMMALVDNPALLNADPYANWLIKLKISDRSGLDKLIKADAYDKANPAH